MIITFSFRLWRASKRLLRRSHAGGMARTGGGGRGGGGGLAAGGPASQAGFALIEVIVSALLVGFIAIATFNGFDVVNRATADQRFHDQAAVIASQSQELLRSDPASTLDELQNEAHTYTQTLGKEKYTITEEVSLINEAKQSAGCSATSNEATVNNNGDYIRITSKVTWPQLLAANRPAVSQSSLITPPDGSGLEVDATNGGVPLQPVPGVTAIVKQPSAKTEAEAVTGENGCVVFGAIPATKVNVEAYKLGDVTESGAFKATGNEILITPNRTTRYAVTFAQGGAITAEFTYQGKTIYNEKQVTGDTFVVENGNIKINPKFELGSTQLAYNGEGAYEAKTGTYKTEATTPISATYYPTGDLFPFENTWGVYAGDCPLDLPPEKPAFVLVKPGANTKIAVPMSFVNLSVYEGTLAKPKLLVKAGEYEVKITNTGCTASSIPNNASALNVAHTQHLKGGSLEAPFQPFGEFQLCLFNSALKRTYTVNYKNTTVAGSSPTIYLEQKLGEKEGSKEVTVAEAQKSC